MGDVDLALRHVATQHPEDLVGVFLPNVAPSSMRWFDSQVARAERRVDKGLLVGHADGRTLLHTEWFIEPHAAIGRRIHEYQYLLSEALRVEDETRARSAPDQPDAPPASFVSVAVMLSGAASDTTSKGEHRLSPSWFDFSGTVYVVDRVYQLTTEELLARPGSFWLVFAPLARDASPRAVGEAVQTAERRSHSREEFVDLAAAIAVMASAAPQGRSLQEAIMNMLGSDIIKNNWIFKQGHDEGLDEGREQGEIATLRRSILTVLSSRGLRVTDEQRAAIEATSDRARLDVWFQAALVARSTREMLLRTSAPAPRRRVRRT